MFHFSLFCLFVLVFQSVCMCCFFMCVLLRYMFYLHTCMQSLKCMPSFFLPDDWSGDEAAEDSGSDWEKLPRPNRQPQQQETEPPNPSLTTSNLTTTTSPSLSVPDPPVQNQSPLAAAVCDQHQGGETADVADARVLEAEVEPAKPSSQQAVSPAPSQEAAHITSPGPETVRGASASPMDKLKAMAGDKRGPKPTAKEVTDKVPETAASAQQQIPNIAAVSIVKETGVSGAAESASTSTQDQNIQQPSAITPPACPPSQNTTASGTTSSSLPSERDGVSEPTKAEEAVPPCDKATLSPPPATVAPPSTAASSPPIPAATQQAQKEQAQSVAPSVLSPLSVEKEGERVPATKALSVVVAEQERRLHTTEKGDVVMVGSDHGSPVSNASDSKGEGIFFFLVGGVGSGGGLNAYHRDHRSRKKKQMLYCFSRIVFCLTELPLFFLCVCMCVHVSDCCCLCCFCGCHECGSRFSVPDTSLSLL
jgi:hypothetical protein